MKGYNGMKRIVVCCPAYIASGGPELLHQLCFKLIKAGYNAVMGYYGITNNSNNDNNISPKVYSKYNNPYIKIKKYNETKDDIVVIPETFIGAFKLKAKIRILWWLSVDNFKGTFIGSKKHIHIRIRPILPFIGTQSYLSKLFVRKKIDYHLVQSYYAEDYVKKLGIENNKIMYLSDYLNNVFINNVINNSIPKKNIVLYNPKKGIEYTKKLILYATHIKWVPLENLSREQMSEVLQSAKVYIDFGNHPGKDRIPREAAISGCCVITGKRGSAGFYEDVPIPNELKFNEENFNCKNICDRINDVFDNYGYYYGILSNYRTIIKNEEAKFDRDLKEVFSRIVK